jgi:UDP-N-acetyl-2-amino-2-deoxyglucuronate dehydrogenase
LSNIESVGVALIGAGFIADYHLDGLAAVPAASVRVIADRTLAKAQDVAARHGVPLATDDVEAALRRPDVKAAIITTPDDTHEAVAVQALRAGRAVLLQKPMAPTSGACRRILAVAAQSGCDLQVSFMHRYFEEVVAARSLLAAGAIGRVTSVRVRNATPGPDWGDWFFRRDVVGGGVVLQLGAHGIDLIGLLFGRVASVSAHTATLVPERRLKDGRVVAVENPDTAVAVYEVENGPIVYHEMSMIEVAGTDRFRMEIYGTGGTLWLRTERGLLASFRTGDETWTAHSLPRTPFGVRQHREWIDSLLAPLSRPTSATDALQGQLVADAITRSAECGGCRTDVERA